MANWVSSAVSAVAGRAVSAAPFIAESAASAAVGKIVEAGFSFLSSLIQPRDSKDKDSEAVLKRLAKDSEAELKRLEKALPQIREVMNIAEVLKAKDPSLGAWFDQFRNAVEAAEDVLDELEYKKLEAKVRKQDEEGGSTSRSKKPKSCPISKDTLARLEEAVRMLDEAAADVKLVYERADRLGVRAFSELQQLAHKDLGCETTSFLTEREVFGREVEKKQIIGWLKRPSDDHLSCFSIIGAGGLGKTTLAQFAYQEMSGSNHFDKTIWVCVSTNFSVEHITRKILGELGESSCDGKPLNALHEILKEKIHSKKILLVLDDVWDDENGSNWERLLAPLQNVQKGSKILVTTRMQSVADLLVSVINMERGSLELKGLPEKELLQLFNSYAFCGFNPENHADLRTTGEKIVKVLKSSPLAAKVIGSLLNSRMDNFYWRRVLDCGSLFNLDQANNVMEILKLSYYHLPANLQACFRFCSIFPQDHHFEKEELIKMWMACGFLKCNSYPEERLEDIGEDYFNQLLRKSFFEILHTESYTDSKRIFYVMHDLVHELAQNVSNGECCRVEPCDKLIVIPSHVRHISIPDCEIERVSHLKNLCSLVTTMDHNLDLVFLSRKIIKKSLRLLRISKSSRCCRISEEISHLVHLRYLSINEYIGPPSERLILGSIHKLYHLQVLELCGDGWYSFPLEIKPSKLTNLVSLRYMRLPGKLMDTISGVRKLTSLQELTFYVGKESGHHINELHTLNNVRDLSIHNLENVGDPVEAKSANLLGKKNLWSLSLKWSSENSASNSEKIIENLQPNPDLTKLEFRNYNGQKSPSWIKDLTLLNLSILKLHNCPRLKDELFSCYIPCLKILNVYECPELDRLPDMPLSLTELEVEDVGLTSLPNLCQNSSGSTGTIQSSLKIVKIKGCSNLISLDGFLQQDNMDLRAIEHLTILCCDKLKYLPTGGFRNLTSLKHLSMAQCPNLTGCLNLPHSLIILEIWKLALSAIPSLPLSATKLNIYDVPVDTLLENITCSDSSGGPYIEPLKSSLRDVNIAKCQNITSLNGFLQQEYVDFQSLEKMSISSCWNLVQLPKHAFRKFLSLTELIIWDCPMLMADNDESNLLPISVKVLSICNCGQIEVQLLKSASRLTALNELSIEKCANITNIPCSENAFESLCRLSISGCDKLIEHSSSNPAHGVNPHGINLASLKINSIRIDNISLLLIEPLRSLRFVSELTIFNCSGMDAFSQQWLLQNNSTLRRLTLEKATLKSMPGAIVRLTALECLEILECESLEKIQELPSSLRSLQIIYVKSLKSLPATMVSLTAFERLSIDGADLLEELPELPASLRDLSFWGAKSLKSLPATMASLTALEDLTIKNADMLHELPELPTSLRYLELAGAKSLKSLPATMASLTALQRIIIEDVDLLHKLPELPRSLRVKSIKRSDGTELCT